MSRRVKSSSEPTVPKPPAEVKGGIGVGMLPPGKVEDNENVKADIYGEESAQVSGPVDPTGPGANVSLPGGVGSVGSHQDPKVIKVGEDGPLKDEKEESGVHTSRGGLDPSQQKSGIMESVKVQRAEKSSQRLTMESADFVTAQSEVRVPDGPSEEMSILTQGSVISRKSVKSTGSTARMLREYTDLYIKAEIERGMMAEKVKDLERKMAIGAITQEIPISSLEPRTESSLRQKIPNKSPGEERDAAEGILSSGSGEIRNFDNPHSGGGITSRGPSGPNDGSESGSDSTDSLLPKFESRIERRARERKEYKRARKLREKAALEAQGGVGPNPGRRQSLEQGYTAQALGIPIDLPKEKELPKPMFAYTEIQGDDIAATWDKGAYGNGRMAVKGVPNPAVAHPVGQAFNLVRKSGGVLTVKTILEWVTMHRKFLVQVWYPLFPYVDATILAQLEWEYLRGGPTLHANVPNVSPMQMENHELLLTIQLLVRPRDTRDFVMRVEESLLPPVDRIVADFNDTAALHMASMRSLMHLRNVLQYVMLNDGGEYAPTSLSFQTDNAEVDQYGRDRAEGMGALVMKCLGGHLTKIIKTFFQKGKSAEIGILAARPNFSGEDAPKDIFDMIKKTTFVLEYFRAGSEGLNRLRLEYEGPKTSLPHKTKGNDAQLEKPRAPKEHHALRMMHEAQEYGHAGILDAFSSFGESIQGLLDLDLEGDEYEKEYDQLYAMAYGEGLGAFRGKENDNSGKPCWSAMNSSDGKCRKEPCDFNHGPEVIAKGLVVAFHRLTKSFYYDLAIKRGYILQIKFGPNFDPSSIPEKARAIVSRLPPAQGLAGMQGRGQGPRALNQGPRPFPERNEAKPPHGDARLKGNNLHYAGHIEKLEEEEGSGSEGSAYAEELTYHVNCRTLRLENRECESPSYNSKSTTPENFEPVPCAEINTESCEEVNEDPCEEVFYVCNIRSVMKSPVVRVELRDAALAGAQDPLTVCDCMFDSGATGNFISGEALKKFAPSVLEESYRRVNSVTSFGNGQSATSTQEVSLRVSAEYEGVKLDANIPLIVIDSDQFAVILGMPALLRCDEALKIMVSKMYSASAAIPQSEKYGSKCPSEQVSVSEEPVGMTLNMMRNNQGPPSGEEEKSGLEEDVVESEEESSGETSTISDDFGVSDETSGPVIVLTVAALLDPMDLEATTHLVATTVDHTVVESVLEERGDPIPDHVLSALEDFGETVDPADPEEQALEKARKEAESDAEAQDSVDRRSSPSENPSSSSESEVPHQLPGSMPGLSASTQTDPAQRLSVDQIAASLEMPVPLSAGGRPRIEFVIPAEVFSEEVFRLGFRHPAVFDLQHPLEGNPMYAFRDWIYTTGFDPRSSTTWSLYTVLHNTWIGQMLSLDTAARERSYAREGRKDGYQGWLVQVMLPNCQEGEVLVRHWWQSFFGNHRDLYLAASFLFLQHIGREPVSMRQEFTVAANHLQSPESMAYLSEMDRLFGSPSIGGYQGVGAGGELEMERAIAKEVLDSPDGPISSSRRVTRSSKKKTRLMSTSPVSAPITNSVLAPEKDPEPKPPTTEPSPKAGARQEMEPVASPKPDSVDALEEEAMDESEPEPQATSEADSVSSSSSSSLPPVYNTKGWSHQQIKRFNYATKQMRKHPYFVTLISSDPDPRSRIMVDWVHDVFENHRLTDEMRLGVRILRLAGFKHDQMSRLRRLSEAMRANRRKASKNPLVNFWLKLIQRTDPGDEVHQAPTPRHRQSSSDNESSEEDSSSSSSSSHHSSAQPDKRSRSRTPISTEQSAPLTRNTRSRTASGAAVPKAVSTPEQSTVPPTSSKKRSRPVNEEDQAQDAVDPPVASENPPSTPPQQVPDSSPPHTPTTVRSTRHTKTAISPQQALYGQDPPEMSARARQYMIQYWGSWDLVPHPVRDIIEANNAARRRELFGLMLNELREQNSMAWEQASVFHMYYPRGEIPTYVTDGLYNLVSENPSIVQTTLFRQVTTALQFPKFSEFYRWVQYLTTRTAGTSSSSSSIAVPMSAINSAEGPTPTPMHTDPPVIDPPRGRLRRATQPMNIGDINTFSPEEGPRQQRARERQQKKAEERRKDRERERRRKKAESSAEARRSESSRQGPKPDGEGRNLLMMGYHPHNSTEVYQGLALGNAPLSAVMRSEELDDEVPDPIMPFDLRDAQGERDLGKVEIFMDTGSQSNLVSAAWLRDLRRVEPGAGIMLASSDKIRLPNGDYIDCLGRFEFQVLGQHGCRRVTCNLTFEVVDVDMFDMVIGFNDMVRKRDLMDVFHSWTRELSLAMGSYRSRYPDWTEREYGATGRLPINQEIEDLVRSTVDDWEGVAERYPRGNSSDLRAALYERRYKPFKLISGREPSYLEYGAFCAGRDPPYWTPREERSLRRMSTVEMDEELALLRDKYTGDEDSMRKLQAIARDPTRSLPKLRCGRNMTQYEFNSFMEEQFRKAGRDEEWKVQLEELGKEREQRELLEQEGFLVVDEPPPKRRREQGPAQLMMMAAAGPVRDRIPGPYLHFDVFNPDGQYPIRNVAVLMDNGAEFSFISSGFMDNIRNQVVDNALRPSTRRIRFPNGDAMMAEGVVTLRIAGSHGLNRVNRCIDFHVIPSEAFEVVIGWEDVVGWGPLMNLFHSWSAEVNIRFGEPVYRYRTDLESQLPLDRAREEGMRDMVDDWEDFILLYPDVTTSPYCLNHYLREHNYNFPRMRSNRQVTGREYAAFLAGRRNSSWLLREERSLRRMSREDIDREMEPLRARYPGTEESVRQLEEISNGGGVWPRMLCGRELTQYEFDAFVTETRAALTARRKVERMARLQRVRAENRVQVPVSPTIRPENWDIPLVASVRCSPPRYDPAFRSRTPSPPTSSRPPGGPSLMMMTRVRKPDNPVDPTLVPPWSEPMLEVPPEELDTPEAASFSRLDGFALDNEEKVKALEDYREQIKKSVSKEIVALYPDALEFLMSEECISVFIAVISGWEGIKGNEDIELQFTADMPEERRQKARPIPPHMLLDVEKEVNRMLGYFLERSTSPCSSPMVCAPKASPPYIRLCGDYRWINKFIVIPKDYIPHVRLAIEKARTFKYFSDLDCTNAFHQHRLAPYTRQRLAIVTPWGLFQPIFLPEGVGPASGILQSRMVEIFKDYEEWMIVIFDNILVLANDLEDCWAKTKLVIRRCFERNVKLKMSKTYIGVTKVLFFGYEIKNGAYRLSDERRASIEAIPMPSNQKQMQSLIGSAQYFRNHVPNFSNLTAILTEMTKKDFSWDPGTWKKDYRAEMVKLKEAIVGSQTVHFPDYELEWVLRTDASDVAVGGTLLQILPELEDGKPVYQVIAFVSQKFSGAATRWDIPKKEAYAIFFCVKALAYYLHGKYFVIETDHANLVWMEKSEVHIIIRWRMFLQGFWFVIRHIPGKANVFADMLSRMYVLLSSGVCDPWKGAGDDQLEEGSTPERSTLEGCSRFLEGRPNLLPLEWNTILLGATEYAGVMPPAEECLAQAHVFDRRHCSSRTTRHNLNKLFPGHRVHYDLVKRYVETCPVCQKLRAPGAQDVLQPIIYNLKPAHQRSVVGVDTFLCSPPDKAGHVCIHVVVNHFTSFAFLYPAKDNSAKSMAAALFKFFITYGRYDEIVSDPGSNLTAALTEELIRLFGTRHRFSMVGVHTASGVEGTNSLICRLLRAVCADKDFRDRWGDDDVVGLVQFMINDGLCSETGVRRFDAMFGSEAGTYLKLPEKLVESLKSDIYLKLLDEDMRRLNAIVRSTHEEVIKRRGNGVTEQTRNEYQAGELVLHRRDPEVFLPNKLTLPYEGPFEVLEQVRNRVKCRHLATHEIRNLPMDALKIFHGTLAAAVDLARKEKDQTMVRAITAWKGDPDLKTTLAFRVLFEDGDICWLPLTKDLDATAALGSFLMTTPPLRHLAFQSASLTAEFLKSKRKEVISNIAVRDVLYVDVRCYGHFWYDEVLTYIEDRFDKLYVVEYQITEVFPRRLHAVCGVYNEVWDAKVGSSVLNAYWVYAWTRKDFDDKAMILVTKELVLRYPRLVPWDMATQRATLLHHFPDLLNVDGILAAVNDVEGESL